MRIFAAILIMLGSFFFGGLLTMALSDLIVSPFGLHGFSYPQALAVEGMLGLMVVIGAVVSTIVGILLDD